MWIKVVLITTPSRHAGRKSLIRQRSQWRVEAFHSQDAFAGRTGTG